MTEQPELDPIELLRGIDPVDPRDVPSASLARVAASVQENIVTDNRNARPDGRPSQPARLLTALGVTVAALALVVIVGLPKLSSPGPTQVAVVPSPTTETPSESPAGGGPITGGGGTAMCIRYDVSILATFDLAFDGTVSAVDGTQVTFTVNTSFRGNQASEITLTNPAGVLGTNGSVDLEVGARYLVAGSGSTVVGCGYTQPYDPTVAVEWATALGS